MEATVDADELGVRGESAAVVACTHGQRWEHWIPAFHRIESGKLVCGSEKDDRLFPHWTCPCSENCECRRPREGENAEVPQGADSGRIGYFDLSTGIGG